MLAFVAMLLVLCLSLNPFLDYGQEVGEGYLPCPNVLFWILQGMDVPANEGIVGSIYPPSLADQDEGTTAGFRVVVNINKSICYQ